MGEQKKVGFWSGHLGERGTDVGMFNYAHYNEKILNNESIIFYPKKSKFNNSDVIEKFKTRFKVIGVDNFSQIDQFLINGNIKYFFNIKYGKNDNEICNFAKNCIQCVFTAKEPHGDVYCTIAKWVDGNHGKYPVIPRIISLPYHEMDMRSELGIPDNATVFGGYGGPTQFSIKMAQQAVYNTAKKRNDIYFLFANFNKFCKELPNIIHLPCIVDLNEKVEFINTCDAMIWGRDDGETFGQAIAEFSSKNKPVIATDKKTTRRTFDKCHVYLLGNKAIWYDNQKNLEFILQNFDKDEMAKKDWNAYSDYTPEKVMKIFDEVFLK
jgi:hypothetical protein